MLSLREDLSTALELPGMSLTQFEADTGASKFDLSLQLEESAERVSGWFEYNTDLFDAGRISRMAAHFEHLLEAIITGPWQPISRLSLLTPVEQTQMLLNWNDTYAPFQTQVCVHEMFEAQAEQIPNALALATDAARLTFAELNEKANRLAQRLRTAGVGPEVLVAVYIERSAEMVIALLAILKAGGAYLPLEPADPEEVSVFKLEDAGVRLLLTTHQRENSIPRYRTAVLFVDDIDDDPAGHENPVSDVTPENLAYVIYTSGSTGRPKGVAVQHAGLANLVNWHRQSFNTSSADRATQLARLDFDASVLELWPLLAAGASIHMPDEETRLSPAALLEWLTEKAITFSFLPTPIAEAVLQESWPERASLRVMTVGGDKLQSRPSAKPFDLFNLYGPTENSVVATAGLVDFTTTSSEKAPDIGRPIANVQTYVLDAHMQAAPVGIPGELYIGGASVVRGYLNRPELTAERFVPNPFSREPGERLYKTGDLACYASDGRIEFLGRVDEQVKI